MCPTARRACTTDALHWTHLSSSHGNESGESSFDAVKTRDGDGAESASGNPRRQPRRHDAGHSTEEARAVATWKVVKSEEGLLFLFPDEPPNSLHDS